MFTLKKREKIPSMTRASLPPSPGRWSSCRRRRAGCGLSTPPSEPTPSRRRSEKRCRPGRPCWPPATAAASSCWTRPTSSASSPWCAISWPGWRASGSRSTPRRSHGEKNNKKRWMERGFGYLIGVSHSSYSFKPGLGFLTFI